MAGAFAPMGRSTRIPLVALPVPARAAQNRAVPGTPRRPPERSAKLDEGARVSRPSPKSAGLEHAHTVRAIRARLASRPGPGYVRDWVYGGIDGAVTTLAVVAGVIGAELSPGVVLILGFANLLADGFSMAASNYSGTKAEVDDYRRLEAIERQHIAVSPEGERAEVREIYAAKGFEGRDLERAVRVITADEGRWVDTMLSEEYGLPAVARSPIKSALSTFVAFGLCGAVPLAPFIMGLPATFETSTLLTALVFFGIGAVKARWSTAPWWRSGLETLAIGLAAAGLAFVAGYGLRRYAL
jgi:VIT1/CCC1 family predicted Fe2+/Mn2+ transporter